MNPVQKTAQTKPNKSDAVVVDVEATLTEIIEKSIAKKGDVLVQDKEKIIGIINQTDILKTVIEGTETS